MHIRAQSTVELDRKVVRVLSGSGQHVAITTSITNSIALSITGQGGDVGPDAYWILRIRSFVGLDVGRIEKTRGFEDLDVRWTVKTCGFVGLGVRWTVKTRGFVGLEGGGS